eukprot:PITA_09757
MGHIPDEKHKALEPKSEKCIFVGYYEDVKGYKLIPLKSKNVIIRRDVNFAKNISAYELSSVDVPPLSIPSTSENISSSDDDSEDDNPPSPSQDPPSTPQLPKWVHATRDAAEASGHLDWDTTMNEEYRSLLANDIWDLVPLLKGQKFVRCKWLYKTKYGPDGKVDKHKARLVVKGFLQVEGIDYTETFFPIDKMNSIHLVLSFFASFKWEVHKMDVKSTFLHGDLHEEIYMEQPTSFIQTDSSLVCWFKKSLYDLKQARRACAEASPLLVGFTDSDWAGDPDDRKFTAGYVFTLHSGPITWAYKKRSAISLSSIEAEYHSVVEASKEALWLRQLLLEFGF